jgi:hypothetical protein
MSQAPITAANWSSATVVPGLPNPQVAGSRQSVTVAGLTQGVTYYFALRSVDDAGNWSGLSNVLRWDWVLDTAPPAAPSGVAAAREGASGARVTWAANAEPDLAGYTVYRAGAAGGPYTPVSGSLLSGTEFVDGTIPAGTAMVWYQISATDDSGNESSRSAAIALSLADAVAGEWTVDPAYPNPGAPGQTMRIPVVVPGTGAQGAVLEITNAGGQRVRRLELGSLGTGAQQIQWDGRNDAGRDVAPGVYTGWLIAGQTRLRVKLVRVP